MTEEEKLLTVYGVRSMTLNISQVVGCHHLTTGQTFDCSGAESVMEM